MLLMFSRGFKDIVTKTAFFKEFPGLENKFQNSRGFKEIKDPYEPWLKEEDVLDRTKWKNDIQYHSGDPDDGRSLRRRYRRT